MKENQNKMGQLESTKGFLYEIKDSRDNLVAHLFGSIHELSPEHVNNLDKSVLKRFDDASHVFFEIEFWQDEQTNFMEMLSDMLKEREIKDALMAELPGIDWYLFCRALSQSKPIKGLETKESRAKCEEIGEKATEKLQIKRKSLLEKAECIIAFLLKWQLNLYNKIASDVESMARGNTDITFEQVLEKANILMDYTFYLIKNQKYIPAEARSKFMQVVESTDRFMGAIDPSFENVLRIALFATLKYDANIDHYKMKTVRDNYLQGNENLIPKEQVMSDLDVIVGSEIIPVEGLQARDAVMAEAIHKDLCMPLESQENRCGFYVMGALHLQAPCKLIELLEQKGWKINKIKLSDVPDRDHQIINETLAEETVMPPAKISQDAFFKNPRTIYDESIRLFKSGNIEQACGLFHQALKQYKQPSRSHNKERAFCCSALASCYRDLGDYEKAKHYCDKANVLFNEAGLVEDSSEIKSVKKKLDGIKLKMEETPQESFECLN